MSTIFWKTLRTSPAWLCAILGVTHAAFGSEALTAVQTDRTQLITATARPALLSQKTKKQSKQEIERSDISQVTDFSGKSTSQSNLLDPSYSLKANDLKVNNTLGQHHLLNFTPDAISQTDTQQPNQPASPPPNKNQYNLLNPTPTQLMRSFNPSRPSKTDSPYTVDAGHIQIESDLVNYSRNTNTPGVSIDTYHIIIPTIRVGILNNVDFQLQLQTYNNVHAKFTDGSKLDQSGYGDTIASVRVNLWGNDGGQTAFGIVSSIKFPTNNGLGNDSIEGSIGFPLAIQLSDRWNLALETAFNFNRDVADTGNNLGFINSASLGYQVTNKLGIYGEIFTNITTEAGSDLIATFDTGVTYLLSSNFQVDAGINFGLTKAADNLNPFVGFTVRF